MYKFYLTCVVAFCFHFVQAQKTIVHCGTLIDGKSNDAQPQMTIVIEGNKITAVEKGYTKPGQGDRLVDLTKKTVMPGLIDMHVHLEGETNKDQALQRFTLNDADVAFKSTVFAKKTLMAGLQQCAILAGQA
jgi:imidazolonepropionase-like amidohydrolase